MQDIKKFVSNSLIVIIGSVAASAFSYLFNMLMGRMLGPSQYGEMMAITSLLMIVSVGGTAVLTIIMRYSGELYHKNHYKAISILFKSSTRYLFSLSALIFIISLFLSKSVASFLSISSTLPVIIGFSTILLSLVVVINRGILQGTQQFLSLSLINVLEMFLRLVLGVLLVWLGFKINGSISAMVIATAIAYLISFVPIKKILKQAKKDQTPDDFHFDRKEIISYSLPTILSTFFLVALQNIDVILVKHYFASDIAGKYAVMSTIAKIILYLTAPIITVMFPMISEKQAKNEKHYQTLLSTFVVTIVASILILGVYFIAPSLITRILYGNAYTDLSYLLPQIGIFVLFFTLINLMVNYFLAVKNFVFIWLLAIFLAFQITAIGFYHPSVIGIVKLLVSSTGLLFGIIMVYYFYTKRSQISLMIRGQYGEES